MEETDINSLESDPSSLSAEDLWTEIGDGTTFVSNHAVCASNVTDEVIDLGSSADSDLEANLVDDWWGVGIKYNNEVRDSLTHRILWGGDIELQVSYYDGTPEAVTILDATDITFNSVSLNWTAPFTSFGNITGYQINYTTPHGNPTTVITNDTGNTDHSTTVSSLNYLTDYSFRVAAWTELGTNATGKILNVTTLDDFSQANFTVGNFDVNATNDEVVGIFFERQDINSTALLLNVTYPNMYNLACDFDYKFANTNNTYYNLTSSAVDATRDESSFQFIDVNNEIIDVYCWDVAGTDDGAYIITQTDFPLLSQIASFRSGEYGTDGDIGVIDFITIAVIILSMIGMNRVNETVGAIFNVSLLGALAYFEIIELPTIIFGALAVFMMLIIGSTKKT